MQNNDTSTITGPDLFEAIHAAHQSMQANPSPAGMRVNFVRPQPVLVRRPLWKRLFSRPWRPWRSHECQITPQVMRDDQAIFANGSLYVTPLCYERLKEQLTNGVSSRPINVT